MIVDCEYYLDWTRGDEQALATFRELHDENRTDYVVTMPVVEFTPDNAHLASLIKGNTRCIGAALINPNFGQKAVDELERAVKEWGFRCLKLMNTRHGYRILEDAVVRPVVEKAASLGVVITVHSSQEGCHPLEIGALAGRYPETTFIMDHMGYRYHSREAIVAAQLYPNLYLMTTAVAESGAIRTAAQAVGSERVVFGSNGPSMIPSIGAEAIRRTGLPDKDVANMLGDVAACIYGLH